MSRIIILVKYAKPKKDFFAESEEGEDIDESGLDKRTRVRLGLENEEETQFNVESKFEKMFNEKNLEFYYKPYGINTQDIHDFYPLDEEHTILITEFGGLLPAKIAWKDWLAIWEKYSGEAIFIIDNVKKIEIK